MATSLPAGSTPRRPQLSGAERREAILDAAVLLFSQQAFRGTGILRLIVADLVDHPDLARLFTVLLGENLSEGDPLHSYFRDRHVRMRAYFARAITAGQAAGTIRADVDGAMVGTEVAAFIVGAQTEWLLDPGGVDLVAVFGHYLDRLLRDVELAPAR